MSFGNAYPRRKLSSFNFGDSSSASAYPPQATFNFGSSSPVNISQAASVNVGASTSVTASQGSDFSFAAPLPVDIPKTSVFNFALLERSVTHPVKLEKRKNSCVDHSTQTEELHVIKCVQVLAELLQSGHYSDVILNVKGKEFSVHSKILSAHSPVFAAMMAHDTKEKATGIVNIDDCDPDLLSDFLHFLYSGNLNLNPENVVDLYAVADKYQVSEFSKACVAYMKTHISVENFCDIMALSLRYQEKELMEVATNYFVQNSITIAKKAKWLTFIKENLVAGNELFLKALDFEKRRL